MAISRVSDAERTYYEQLKFRKAVPDLPDPLEPYAVKAEVDRFKETVPTLADPILDTHTRMEQEKFAQEAAQQAPLAPQVNPLPAPQPPEAELMNASPPAPAVSSQPEPATPDGSAPSGAPADMYAWNAAVPAAVPDDDPVQRTLTYLKGLGGEEGMATDKAPPAFDVAGEMAKFKEMAGTFAPKAMGAEWNEGVVQEPPPPDPLESPGIKRMLDKTEQNPSPLLGAVQNIGDAFGGALDAGAQVVGPLAQAGQDERRRLTDQLGRQTERIEREGGSFTDQEIDASLTAVQPFAEAVLSNAPDMPKIPIDPDQIAEVARKIVLPDGPGAMLRNFGRSRDVIGAMGEAGAEIAERVHQARRGTQETAGDFVGRVADVLKLPRREFVNMVDVLEGNAQPITPRVAQAAAKTKGVLEDVYALAENAGVKVAERIENYWPHHFRDDLQGILRDASKRQQIAEALLAGGQSADEAKATMVRWQQGAHDRRHGSLEFERLSNLGGYEKTPLALMQHLTTTAKRINEVAAFGKDDAIVNRLFERLSTDGYDTNQARDLFQRIVGSKDYTGSFAPGLASGLRKANAVTSLFLSGLSNATQPTNVATVAGLVRTIKHVPGALFSATEKADAARAAVTLDSVLREMRNADGGVGDRLTKYAMPLFGTIEKFNRVLTSAVAKDFAAYHAERAVKGNAESRRALEALELDADAIVKRGGALDPKEVRTAIRALDERTQFQVDPQDLPGWADSPWGKVFTQFGRFGYNQSHFVWQEALKPALQHKDVRPLLRLMIYGTAANAAATEGRNFIAGRDMEEDPVRRVAQYAMGPLGTVGSIARAVLPINSDRLPVARQGAMLAGAALGPSLGKLMDAGGGVAALLQGDPVPAARLALRNIPGVGPLAVNRVFPYEKKDMVMGGRSSVSSTSGGSSVKSTAGSSGVKSSR